MLEPKILVEGTFSPEDIVITFAKSTLKIEPEIQEKIDVIWNEKLAEAKEKNMHLYNGETYRINSLSHINNLLHVELATLDFKTRASLKYIPEAYEMSEDHLSKGGATQATIQTADGYFVMVELSGKSLNTNSIDMLGGYGNQYRHFNGGRLVSSALCRTARRRWNYSR